ncbi:DUF4389 domain-containing protein [Kitasatospora sp. CM 4170]|uniref:DUF4389 domain-containing protein n=1 Tax=Kitasatospora aburaviensis TaxID=67265 RepID=A0ABW1EXN3_9ACTN|nr:DUF4389 domain-containing protein [Kitasatospora sp. CM 4170]WNM43831.1 DUF4389 domain-containing protein [Kitasatospora sp. CM 4170]
MWQAPPAPPPFATEWLPVLDMPKPGEQNRLTVLFRILLLIPQFIVVWVLSVVAFFVAVIGWFGALVLGRLPMFAADYLSGYVPYETRVTTYLMLTHDSYPPFRFRTPEYPVQVELRPGELNRLAVFFRLILVIPAAIIQGVVFAGWWMVALISWVVVLVLGRMPEPLFESTAAILRYRMRYMAYLLMLTPAYPKRLFGDEPGEAEGGPVSATRPLVLSGGGRGLLVVFIILGIVSWGASSITASIDDDDESKHVSGPLVPGPPVPGPFGRVPPGATR